MKEESLFVPFSKLVNPKLYFKSKEKSSLTSTDAPKSNPKLKDLTVGTWIQNKSKIWTCKQTGVTEKILFLQGCLI